MSTESAAEVPMKRDQSALPDPRPGQNSTNGPVDAYYEGYFHPKPVDLPGPSMPVNPIKFVEGRVEIPSIDPSSVPVSPKRCWQELPHGVLDILADNRYAFPELLNQLGLTGYAVELGVLEGQYSAVFLSKWNGRKLYLVDPWENQDALQYNDINNRNASEFNKLVRKVEGILSPYAGRYEAIRRFSFEAASMFPDVSRRELYLTMPPLEWLCFQLFISFLFCSTLWILSLSTRTTRTKRSSAISRTGGPSFV
jgi:hypothetical protein